MLQSKDFSAWISIEGVDAPEYGVEISENQEELSCWIPSEVGKKFTVHWSNISAPGLTGGGVQVDGHKCGFEAIASETRPISAFMDGIAETDTKTRPFVFALLDLTDDDAYLESASHPNLGLIKLEIWRVDVAGVMAPAVAVPSKQLVHERAKKAMNQQITFGAAVEHAHVQSAQIRRIGYAPLCTFSFKYRSLDVLRANDIAPPPQRAEKRKASSSPKRPSAEGEADSDVEEAARLKERLETLTAKRAKNDAKKVKKEPSTGPATSIKLKAETIAPLIKSEPSET
ncbi:hypothetical protein DFH07DRAFT_790347 [Mycena maculata]|uniref:DUF7918 domain-containing protein n=1 Tax=Mycena maculata TaxID=230809 RepID=A0AAD7KBR6_9AGAR|nr:hypothetical protein DFH07DRAFT_790347 [Mycena maculata]